jgi:hypothetical protein
MCNVSEKLIFWLDRELPDNEAAGIERHVQGCAECRTRLEAYKEVGRALDAYCGPESPSSARRTPQLWSPALAGVAAAIALLLTFPRGSTVERLPLQTSMVSPSVAVETPPAALNTTRPDHASERSAEEQKKRRAARRALRKSRCRLGAAGPRRSSRHPCGGDVPPGCCSRGRKCYRGIHRHRRWIGSRSPAASVTCRLECDGARRSDKE